VANGPRKKWGARRLRSTEITRCNHESSTRAKKKENDRISKEKYREKNEGGTVFPASANTSDKKRVRSQYLGRIKVSFSLSLRLGCRQKREEKRT